MESTKDFVLYVHPDCNGCKKAVPLLQDSRLKTQVDVQDIRYIPEETKPPFLTGTPTLVNCKTKEVLQGTDVLKMLQDDYMSEGVKQLPYAEQTAAGFESAGLDNSFEASMPKMDATKFQQMREQMLQKA